MSQQQPANTLLTDIKNTLDGLDFIQNSVLENQSHLHKGHRESLLNPGKVHIKAQISLDGRFFNHILDHKKRLKIHQQIHKAIAPFMEYIHAFSIQLIMQ